MRRIRGKHSAPEMAVRRLVHRLGFRYRLHRTDLPGTPDLVFSARMKVIFVHGCFWHFHGASRCGIAHTPKSNRPFWRRKLLRNRDRDARTQRQLRALGWRAITVWECQTRDTRRLAKRLSAFLNG